jgi:hypothetical protein
MAIDPRKRAKQIARKAAKRKAQLAKKKNTQGTWSNPLVAGWPIHECYAPGNLFEIGIGNIVISRRIGNQVAAGVFLVDTGCLGVKNAFLRVVMPSEFPDLLDRIKEREPLVPVDAEYARKLVEGAVEYAAELGFKPHKDYRKAKMVFGSIDTALCDTSFEFGKDGKPFYCSGPSESPSKRRQIVDELAKRCGTDGFHYMVGVGDALYDDDEFDDDEFDEEEFDEDEPDDSDGE